MSRDDQDASELARLLRRTRSLRGQSLKAAGRKMATTATTVQRWERGSIPEKAAPTIAGYLDITPEEALDMIVGTGGNQSSLQRLRSLEGEVAELRAELAELRSKLAQNDLDHSPGADASYDPAGGGEALELLRAIHGKVLGGTDHFSSEEQVSHLGR